MTWLDWFRKDAAPTPSAPASSLDRLPMALAAVAPHLSPSAVTAWAGALIAPMRSAGIITPKRIAAFVGQVCEESDGFAVLVENLHYTAPRLCVVWPNRFPSIDAAEPYAGNPEKLADLVYAGRLGNGPSSSGDGWRFRGEGLIQLTGRSLYGRFGASVGKSADECSAFLLTPSGAAQSACWYWGIADHRPSLNALADAWEIDALTRAINGGDMGEASRLALCNKALAALS